MRRFTLLFLTILFSLASQAQIAGTWHGTLSIEGQALPLNLSLSENASGWNGTLQSPAQSEEPIPLSQVIVNSDDLSFTIDAMEMTYNGKVADGRITGTFQQGAFTTLLDFEREAAGETWYAVIKTDGEPQLPLNIQLAKGENDWRGTLQSPNQAEARLPFDKVVWKEDVLEFAIVIYDLQYRGELRGDSIVGTFQQQGSGVPLTFHRTAGDQYRRALIAASSPLQKDTATTHLPRIQDPKNYPYQRKPVIFSGGDPSLTLAGELTLPNIGRPKAALVLVTGSGPQDRNQDLGPQINHRTFLVLSDYLTRQGYAVLRYDDRGVGESTGDFDQATNTDFAADAAAAVSHLRAREEVRGVPIGMLGHSEGGLITPMVIAAGEPAVDFAILLAAPGLPIDSLMLVQQGLLSNVSSLESNLMRTAYQYLKAHPQQDSLSFTVGLRDTLVTTLRPYYAKEALSTEAEALLTDNYVNNLSSPWARQLLLTDPADFLSQVVVPVLALNGELDRQVSPDNLAIVGTILAAAGNEDVTLALMPNLNHLLQPAMTGLEDEYAQIAITLDPTVLETIVEWLDERFAQ